MKSTIEKFKYIKEKVSEKECECLMKLYEDVLQSIATLIQDKLNSYEGFDLDRAFCIVEGAIRHSHQNMFVQMFKTKDTSSEEMDELISNVNEDTKQEVISRVKDPTAGMPFIAKTEIAGIANKKE